MSESMLETNMTELDLWLDEGRFLSGRWVSYQLGISVADATSLLEAYKKSHSDVSACYLVSGEENTGKYRISVVAEAALEEVKSSFSLVNSCQIYSLQRTVNSSVFNQIRTADYKQTSEILNSASDASRMHNNDYGKIVYKKLEVSSAPRKAVPAAVSKLVPKTELVKDNSRENAAETIARRGSHNLTNIGISKDEILKSSAVQNFFKTKPSDSTTPKPLKQEKQNEKVEDEKNLGKTSNETADDDGEWDDGSNYKIDKETLKKRKAPASTATFEERDNAEFAEDNSAVPLENSQNESEEDKERSKKENKFRIHGAMDDFIEDAAINEFKKHQKEGGPAAPASISNKRRKLVPKMFEDEKGYLVTEMVWEECSGDEAVPEQPPKKAHAEPAALKASSKPASSANKASKDANKAGQKSMMSFFGKK